MPEEYPALHEGRGETLDVANAVLFLAFDMSRRISGVSYTSMAARHSYIERAGWRRQSTPEMV